MHDHYTDRLSEYLDDELSADERAGVERHLAACRACSATLAELRRVVGRARALPDRDPAADLWPALAAHIRAAGAPGPAARPAPRRRVSFTIPQLIAAGVTLVLLSGGGAWSWTRWTQPGPQTNTIARVDTTRQVDTVYPGHASPVLLAEPRFDEAVAELERVLDENQGRLRPETARAIEQSLRAIDEAIIDARRALAQDPSSAYLNDYLARTMRRKLDVLRNAAFIVGSQS